MSPPVLLESEIAAQRVVKKTKKPPFATNIAQEELFLMDSYYKELMQSERLAFERILASKLNVHERQVERKFQK